ncbi:MAG: tryptophan 7-halogenase, partial [Planctomycetaceae bacterium]|nr:tryptophan 7-halogenase [Planctomycetaceae bacterium]
TPLADLMIRQIAEEFHLPQLVPLSAYGSWKTTLPELGCGLKRGFSYFHHRPNEEFLTDTANSRQLIVAASPNDQMADTHWLRSDVDAWFARQLSEQGIPLFEFVVPRLVSRSPWQWTLSPSKETAPETDGLEIQAQFVIDASGGEGVVLPALGHQLTREGFQTRSRALYCHVMELVPWHDLLVAQGVDVSRHPFRCDRAAVHHLLEEGWMWQLPFDNGVTSVGILTENLSPLASPDQEWRQILQRYPTLARQFLDAEIVAPSSSVVATGRLQRRWPVLTGADFALLPGTAGFVDPMHSTGIAQSLFAIHELARSFTGSGNHVPNPKRLAAYEACLKQQLEVIDRLIAACYATRSCPDLLEAATMLYFVAAIHTEERIRLGEDASFLSLNDPPLRDMLVRQSQLLTSARDQGVAEREAILAGVQEAIRPWNTAGLLDQEASRMYRYTAAHK